MDSDAAVNLNLLPNLNIPRLPAELSEHLLRLPTTDRGSFYTLVSPSDIQEWATAKANRYRQFTLAVLAIHNLVAPIHRLPAEVLELILEQCWEDWNSLRLPHVCRLWRSIILGSAMFWADAVASCELREKRDTGHNELPLVAALLSRSTQNSHPIWPSFYTFSPSLAQSLTPYISSVVSLEVALDKDDLHERLWPLLLSGMPNLEALEIQPMIMKEELDRYDEDDYPQLANLYSETWTSLPMLSRKALPKLSRLTCPHIMVERFGDVSLKHLKAEWWDREQGIFRMPMISFGKSGGFYLDPYHDSLETLEFVSARGCFISEQSQALELPSLKYLYISSVSNVVSHILSWFSLPQTATIHIADFDFYFARDTTKLRLLASTIGRVHLQLLPRHQGREDYRLECCIGGSASVRLLIDDFSVVRDGLLQLFGEDAPVTRLVLSVSESASSDPESRSVDRAIDLRAFPHLAHLDGCGFDVETVARMLQPDNGVERGSGQVATDADALLCPSLAELVIDISCGFVHRSVAPSSTSGRRVASSSSQSELDPDVDIADELFQQKCSVLQRLLAARASSGTRLTSLRLRLRPSTLTGSDSEASGSVSKDSADAGAAETSVVWPSRAIRQTVVQTLQESVDGPVDFRLRRPDWWRDVYP